MGFMSKGSMDLMCKYYLSGLTRKRRLTRSIMFKKAQFLGWKFSFLTDSESKAIVVLLVYTLVGRIFGDEYTAIGRLFVPHFLLILISRCHTNHLYFQQLFDV